MWDLLKISPTNDIKQIKRAYAKQLKVTRPDEKPKEFQALNEAYQMALNHAKRHADEAVARIEVEEGENRTIEVGLDTLLSNISIPETAETQNSTPVSEFETSLLDNTLEEPLVLNTASFQDDEGVAHHEDTVLEAQNDSSNEQVQELSKDDELAQVLTKVEALLKDKKKRQLPESWNFLTETPSIFDFHFHWELSKAVLVLLYEHRKKAHQDNMPVNEIRASVLFHIDGILNWLHDEGFLRNEVGDDVCDAMLPLIHNFISNRNIYGEGKGIESVRGARIIIGEYETEDQDEIAADQDFYSYMVANKVKRFFSYLIDIFIISFTVDIPLLIINGSIDIGYEYKAPAIIALYFIYAAFQQSSKYQATLGQRLFRIKVVMRDGEKIPRKKVFIRLVGVLANTILGLVLITLLFVLKLLFIIVFIIFAIRTYQNKQAFHDELTSTRVIRA